MRPDTWAAAQWALGATFRAFEQATTFAVHAPAATRVVLEIYAAAAGHVAAAAFTMDRGEDGVWRAKLGNAGPGTLYAFRCWGLNWPFDPAWTRHGSAAGFIADVDGSGNRFNPNKVLFDPYALEISHNLLAPEIQRTGGDPIIFATGGALHRGRPRREIDTGLWAPKGVVVADNATTGVRPRLPAEDAVIYEAHVGNLTRHPSALRLSQILSGEPGFEEVVDIPDFLQGTYAGAGLLAPYLRALGVTTIELLPIHETNSSPRARDRAAVNHWGYQTMGYFAPNRAYSSDRSRGGPTREFKRMVRDFHAAGIEVYLDVVYNHTAEGGNWGGDRDSTGFTSLGGFAVNDYYVQTNDHLLIDGATGSSNQLNHSSAATQQLVLDSLTHWINEFGIDGFRFDLAPVLGRTPNAFEREHWEDQKRFFSTHPLLAAVADLAESKHVEVIAEAWDLWGYEVGNFPCGWGEWNGRYRDAVRAFLKGDGNTHEFMEMVNGDYHNFNDQGGPQRSINFVTAHDGFCLMDLVSFITPVNDQPWPFGPSDGGCFDNLAWDSGGDHALRRTRLRNFLTVLVLSRGVPMFTSGDEYGRTQNGNNNPWSLNAIGMWNNWAQAVSPTPTQLPVDPSAPDDAAYFDVFGTAPTDHNPVFRFTRALLQLRAARHSLRQRNYGNQILDDDDVSYFFARPDGGRVRNGDRSVRLHIDSSGVGEPDLLVLINQTPGVVSFATLPDHRWARLIDTAAWAEAHDNVWTADGELIPATYAVRPWSIAVLVDTTERT
ncbi:alpha-amylase family glycosyl hydrolase [Granulicoccus sp. GXG6511]|uniref:alpha-amylase family glycosyl hydrolase n=1 Tax=Granulicoccus sp. GXG6511 TaxID=3381351 RepID=UPI003D7D7A9C